MKLAKFRTSLSPRAQLGLISGDGARALPQAYRGAPLLLTSILESEDPWALLTELQASSEPGPAPAAIEFLPPIDDQEVWGAGVTYERSKIARREESEQGGSFYDQVYVADRPELFFKATPSRVVGHGGSARIRRDSRWSVPEPELALVINSRMKLVGFTVGNDMSARDIEGRNPLYLPQAKVYDAACGLGPWITLAGAMPPISEITIRLKIERGQAVEFDGSTPLSRMARSFDELISWLAKDNAFPSGVVLLTGTGIVPPDEFALAAGDRIAISIDGIGTLEQTVIQG